MREKKDFIKGSDTISDMAGRIKELTDSILAIARDEHYDTGYEYVSIEEILQNVAVLYERSISSSNIEFIGPNESMMDVKVWCKKSPISQVIYNLINNAIHAIEDLDEKWIEFSIVDTGSMVEFSVTDSGQGISEAIQEKIFEPFYTTKPEGQGTGIGLSICRSIIEENKGELKYDVDSENTRFYFTVPKKAQSMAA